jgi:hypothetical protein
MSSQKVSASNPLGSTRADCDSLVLLPVAVAPDLGVPHGQPNLAAVKNC